MSFVEMSHSPADALNYFMTRKLGWPSKVAESRGRNFLAVVRISKGRNYNEFEQPHPPEKSGCLAARIVSRPS